MPDDRAERADPTAEPIAPAAGDAGAALAGVLLAIVLLGAFATVLVSTVASQVQASAFSRDRETAVHAAESAAELVMVAVAADPAYVTVNAAGAPHEMPSGLTRGEQHQWVVAQYTAARTAAGTPGVRLVPTGRSYGIRPVLSRTSTPARFVFGLGEVGPAGAGRLRVIRYDVVSDNTRVRSAVATNGSLRIANGVSVTTAGSMPVAHANADLVIDDSKAQGPATASGTRTTSLCVGCTPLADSSASHLPRMDLPKATALDIYRSGTTGRAPWYDLCVSPSGRGRMHTWSVNGPCDPRTALASTGQWTFGANGDNRWRYGDNATMPSGVYYAHHASIELGSSVSGQVSLIASIDPAETDTFEAARQGNIDMRGRGRMTCLPGLVGIFADRDLQFGKDYTGTHNECLLVAGEQFQIDDGASIVGALVGLDGLGRPGVPADLPGSPVSSSVLAGSARVHYPGGAHYPPGLGQVGGPVWTELTAGEP